MVRISVNNVYCRGGTEAAPFQVKKIVRVSRAGRITCAVPLVYFIFFQDFIEPKK